MAITPAEAYKAILEGNARFISGSPSHPRQDVDHRSDLATGQYPFAALFGCSDSRLSAEIIFDVGLGDLFVVRNAGQVIAETILGSLEYAVEVLGVPLILVLGHDECGAIKATMEATEGKLKTEGEFIANLVGRIQPTVQSAKENGRGTIDEITEIHVADTISELMSRSMLIEKAVKSGKLAVVGATYRLALGQVTPILTIGKVD
ncbi:MAG: carbonic anhydrase [Actinomycetota bacterium]